ncbi:MAG: efflux RND transporter periplasmic adaptor subunit [Bacteroidota bacterium]
MKQHKIVALTLTTLALATACDTEEKKQATVDVQSKVLPVSLSPIIPVQQGLAITSSGIVGSRKEVRLSFKIGGVVKDVYIQEGKAVRKGQLLASLNTQEIEAQVIQAEAGLAKANRDLERVNQLYQDTVATLEQVQDLTTARDVADANLNIAQFNQKYAKIYAPANGRILKRFAEKGEIIGPGNPVYMLAAEDESQVIRIGISDKDVVRLNLGDAAQITFDALPGKEVKGRVVEIAAGANPRNGTYEVEIALSKNPYNIKNGFVGQVNLYPKAQEGDVKVPMGALVEADRQQAVIYVPDSSHTHARRMTLRDFQLGDSFLIVSGEQLLGIEEVITEGARYLTDDAQINIPNNLDSSLSQK